mgnify:CR=1 FL=1
MRTAGGAALSSGEGRAQMQGGISVEIVSVILVTLVALFAAMDEQLMGASMLGRPLFTGLVIGALTGDLVQGAAVGALFEAITCGFMTIGAAYPLEAYAAPVAGMGMCLLGGVSIGAGAAAALLLAIVFRAWRLFCYAKPASRIDAVVQSCLARHQLHRANAWHLLGLPIVLGVPSALLVACAMWWGSPVVSSLVDGMPEWVARGLDNAALVMACIGVVSLLQTIGPVSLLPVAVLGFLAVSVLHASVLSIVIAAACAAMLLFAATGSAQASGADEEDDF